jgi:hypothetical protein
MLPHLRLFNPDGPDRIAVLRAEPAWSAEERFMLLVSRGASRTKLGKAVLLGPFDSAELESRMKAEAASLRNEGFLPAGLEAMTSALKAGTARTRALSAQRLGWRKEKDAVPALLAAFTVAGFERSSLLDALGLIGDPRALPLARQEAEKKLLSRRRSGVEALRNLGDTEGLAKARTRALERLPEALRQAAAADQSGPQIEPALTALPPRDLGLALDTLYELGTERTAAAVREALTSIDIEAPHVWRYVKSILKRSLLRRDAGVFGLLAYRIERTARKTAGTETELKSGLDGVTRKSPVFRRGTQHYMMRLCWRHLRLLARYEPGLYAATAAEVLVHYRPSDASEPSSLTGSLASCHLFHQILRGRSSRFELVRSSLSFRYRSKKAASPTEAREESFPELWDSSPRAFVHLLANAHLREVHDFALAAVNRAHRHAIEEADHTDIVAFLSAPHEGTVELGLTELSRRFDPAAPDLGLLRALAADGRPTVRELALQWLEASAAVWSSDAETLISLLGARDAMVRDAVARLASPELAAAEPALRQTLAERFSKVLLLPESVPGAHDGFALVATQALLSELAPLFPLEQLIVLLATGSSGARSVAGALLGWHVEALDSIGLTRLAVLGSHEVASLRESVRSLLRRALSTLKEDPSPLFTLVESSWKDSRDFAIGLLREELAPSLGTETALGFLDSTRKDVQALGRHLLHRDLDSIDANKKTEIVVRLAQHPHGGVRRTAMEILLKQPPGEISLGPEILALLRSVLFDVKADRISKKGALSILHSTGVRDEKDARAASALLADFAGTEGKQDFELTITALAAIRLAFPGIPSPLRLLTGAAS